MGTHSGEYLTPNIAKLAKNGLSFTHAYMQPNCAPTRAAILSGQYPARINNDVYVVGNLNRNKAPGISKQEAKFKALLKKASENWLELSISTYVDI